MLGKLFNLGAGSGAGSPPAQTGSHKLISSLESVQEDLHTRNLLFPDPQDLYEHRLNQVFPLSSAASVAASSTNAFDYNGDIELDVRDVRVIIMQDAMGSISASLLYDSQSPPSAPSPVMDRPSTTAGPASHYSVQDARRGPASPRKPSISHSQRPIVIQPDSPKLRQGAFDRRASVHARNQGYAETDGQRAWREYREELVTFSSCIFGNSELMAYKGVSTKVHVVPSETRGTDSSFILGDGRGSIGRSSMRSSRLSQSFSSENIPPTPTIISRVADRKKILVTRLFPVTLPIDEDAAPSPQKASLEDKAEYPFPQSSEELRARKKKSQPKQKRTPMYAVALVINLPPVSAHHTTGTTVKSASRGAGSFAEQDSFPSSFNSSRNTGWTMVGQGGPALESFETSFGSDAEDQMDAITQHWDVIMRTLNRLQTVVASTLYTMLRQADLSSPDPLPPAAFSAHLARTASMSSRRGDEGLPPKPPKTNAKHLSLVPNCLQDNRHVACEAEAAKTRIVAGIRATRVTTGQNRWPIWREEARLVAKSAGGREHGFFFYNLLTGFLATHTDWLQALSPASYRRRFHHQQKGKLEEDSSVPGRTIILSNDKMAARRLIFLLSAFLPASQQLPAARPHRPSTPASLGTLSQSPPSFVVPILKEESLRRKINRRAGPRRASHSRNLSIQSQQGRTSAVPMPLAHLSMEGRHERRPSDAASIRTTYLPIHGSDAMNRKSSAPTTATITSETTVPHFASVQRPDVFASGLPGSGNNSIASEGLKKRLAGDDGVENRQGSRWGSVISGLWGSTRRRDSGAASTKTSDQGDFAGGGNTSPTKSFRRTSQPPVAKPENVTNSSTDEQQTGPQGSSPSSGGDPIRTASGDSMGFPGPSDTTPKVRRTPAPSGAFESPVKTSINLNDGVIDVDVPFPDYITSFETAVSSPSSSGYLSTPGFGTGFDAFEQSFRVAVDGGDIPVNVAGWLQQYHPDFVLQALPAQDGVLEQIKASMQAEPSPTWLPHVASSDRELERWVDVSTALVADTTTFTVTRIRYRRLVRLKPPADRNAVSFNSTYATALMTPSVASPYEMYLKEEFIEEPVFSLDDTLVDAVERVIAVGDLSKAGSAASSRSTSKRRQSVSVETELAAAAAGSSSQPHQSQASELHDGGLSVAATGQQEVPRSQCKSVLLSALEEVIREVMEDREEEQEEGPGTSHARGKGVETVLREAVRVWLEGVDLGVE
ncbi:folliculin-interacting protein N-terminus-domain-containing protein [Podospora conica]|nr:folliculin-interacting protein N-terminus-domain-containing protein [Schizothecium conicum]